MKIQILKPGEALPKGAIQIHVYNVKDILRPRGGILQKESLSSSILERLESAYESWTDPIYGDNPTKEELLEIIETNLEQEFNFARKTFLLNREKEKNDALRTSGN